MAGIKEQHRREMALPVRHSAAVPDGPCDEWQGDHPSGPGPSALRAGGGIAHGDGTAHGVVEVADVDGAIRAARDGWARGLGDAASPGGAAAGDGESHIHETAVGSARPDASLEENNRHCNPVLLDSCPPACLPHMGSARASRSGCLVESE